MEELGCPRCRTTKYRNPSLRLMINTCGHAICEACVDLLFVRESGTCPECSAPLRKSAFRTQLFEDTAVDKEVDVRKQMMKIFNKQESDFRSLREYNDYLEDVENIIDNLISGVDVDATKAKISEYKAENDALIKKNQARLNREKAIWLDHLDKEKKKNELKRKIQDEMEREENEEKRRKHQSLLEDLENNRRLTPQQVLAIHRQKLEPDTSMKTLEERLAIGQHKLTADSIPDFRNSCSTTQTVSSSEPFQYSSVREDILGPPMPSKESVLNEGYLANVREATERDIGGGYNSYIACARALQDAFTGLLWQPCSTVDAIC